MLDDAVFDSSADDEYDAVREATYEYKLSSWFSLSKDRRKGDTIDEKESFELSLLEMLRCFFMPYNICLQMDSTKNWSITINVIDLIRGDNGALGKEKKKIRGPHREFELLTATSDKPYVEFEYFVKETEKTQLFSDDTFDYYCNIYITVVDCRNLSGYLSKSVNFSQPFPVSNVILEMDDEKRVYFVLETLALHSSVFYKFFEEKDTLTKEGKHYVIKMENTDIIGHLMWEKQMGTEDQLRELENRPEIVRTPRYLKNITANKFEFPELSSTYSLKAYLKFKPGEHTFRSVQESILDWKIRWKYSNRGNLFLTIGPTFAGAPNFSALNWSVTFVVTVTLNQKEHKFPTTCTPNRRTYTYSVGKNLAENTTYKYSIKIDIKSMKGLRYFVNDDKLRSFDVRKQSSDVVLKCGDTKLFANIQVLALQSEFFRGMVNHMDMQTMDPDEQLPVVTVETADARTVTRILNYVYNVNRDPLKPQHVMDIIPFADFYIFSRLQTYCEQILIKGQYYPLGIKTLDFAIEYNLHTLKYEYLRRFTCVFEMQKLKKDAEYNEMSKEAKLCILEKMMDLPLHVPRPHSS